MERKHPRPVLVSVAGWLAAGYSLFFFTSAMFTINRDLYDAPAVVVLSTLVPALLVGFGAVAFLAGWNLGRYLYWILTVLWIARVAVYVGFTLKTFIGYLVMLILGAMVAGPGAHWFFTGRDYRRRPGYKAYFDQQKNDARSRKFEY